MNKLMLDGEEVVLVVLACSAMNPYANVHAVPKSWADEHDIVKYDDYDFAQVPHELYNEVRKFPVIGSTTIWEY